MLVESPLAGLKKQISRHGGRRFFFPQTEGCRRMVPVRLQPRAAKPFFHLAELLASP